ncbi:MAG: phosphoglycerate dehydrogenase [Rhodospirillales bacterium]|nr:phosphoglycerate dehydrogenase [Rhodospirillales bacterium]
MVRVAVCEPAIGRHDVLRAELLERFPDAMFNDGKTLLAGEALIGFLRGYDCAIVGSQVMDGAVFAAAPELKVVSKWGVGLDTMDMDAMKKYGVRLGWTAGVNRLSVAELTLSFMLSLLRHIPQASGKVRAGGWQRFIGRHLSGKTVGIVGCGCIGKEVVRLLNPFGCRVLAHDIRDYGEFYEANGVEALGLHELLGEADVVSIHVPSDASTRGLFSAERLAQMKAGAILVNTARGGIVDEGALKLNLKDGRLAAAAFDVFSTEPPDDSELLSLPNFLATPHIGGSADEAILAMGRAAIEGLENARLPDGSWPQP